MELPLTVSSSDSNCFIANSVAVILLYMLPFLCADCSAQSKDRPDKDVELNVGYAAFAFSDQRVIASSFSKHSNPMPNVYAVGFVSGLTKVTFSGGWFYYHTRTDGRNGITRGELVRRRANGYIDLFGARKVWKNTNSQAWVRIGLGIQNMEDIRFVEIISIWESHWVSNEYKNILAIVGGEYSRIIFMKDLSLVASLNGRMVCWNNYHSSMSFKTYRFVTDLSLTLRYSINLTDGKDSR